MGTTEPLDLAPDDTGPMSTIVVVGGAGTIGRRLVPALRANGHRVILAGRTSGDVHVDLTSHSSMRAKFYGQADLVLTGQHHCNSGASFTLTSGVFADEPWRGVTGGGVISGALHGFVLSAAIELPRGMRINVVSPTKIEDSVDVFDDQFPGMRPVSMDQLVEHYMHCIRGDDTGRVIRAYG
jgi:NAD(P)-dependent dehydrogenase (short-subunit alcohol dehydrogenase family)